MAFLNWIAAAALIGSATACIDKDTRNSSGSPPGSYVYNQQSTDAGTHSANGQSTSLSRQPTSYGYQPSAFGYPQSVYYGR